MEEELQYERAEAWFKVFKKWTVQQEYFTYHFRNKPEFNFINMRLILNNLNFKWSWDEISSHPNIHMEDIDKNINLPWDWKAMGKNPNITIEFILKYKNKDWNWVNITLNPEMTGDIIAKHPDLPWNMLCIYATTDMPINYIKNNPSCHWDWNAISSNATESEIIYNPDLPWKWDKILTRYHTEALPGMSYYARAGLQRDTCYSKREIILQHVRFMYDLENYPTRQQAILSIGKILETYDAKNYQNDIKINYADFVFCNSYIMMHVIKFI